VKFKMTVRNYDSTKDLAYDNSFGFPYIVTLHIPKNQTRHSLSELCDFPHRRLFNTFYFQSEADRTMFIL